MKYRNVVWAWFVITMSFFIAPSLSGQEIVQGNVVLASAEHESVVTIEVKVENLPPVYGFELEIQYDPQILNLIPLGNQASKPLASSPLMAHPQQIQLNNQVKNGLIAYSMSRLHPAVPISGAGTLTVVKFEKLNEIVETSVKIKKLKFGTTGGDLIKPDLHNAALTINGQEPSFLENDFFISFIKGTGALLLVILFALGFTNIYARKKQ